MFICSWLRRFKSTTNDVIPSPISTSSNVWTRRNGNGYVWKLNGYVQLVNANGLLLNVRLSSLWVIPTRLGTISNVLRGSNVLIASYDVRITSYYGFILGTCYWWINRKINTDNLKLKYYIYWSKFRDCNPCSKRCKLDC